MRLLLATLGCLLCIRPSIAHPGDDPASGRPILRAERVPLAVRPTIDGRLDDAAWTGAERAVDFSQLRPDPGAPATQRTEALVLYDEDALYVGFRCFDSTPEAIVRQLARRDDWNVSDKVIVAIDSYGDGRTSFGFGVNAGGVKYDLLTYNDTNEDFSWDAVWEVEVGSDAEGWTAEFRIPFSQLRFETGVATAPWRIQFQRDIARTDEKAFWAPILPDVDGFVSRFGTLRGVEGLTAPRRLEVQPYVASRLTREPGEADNPFYSENDLFGSVGGDLKYGLTSNLTLSATINPDFGQVEADPAVVNLSAFEPFFEERRPFFVEGLDVFEFGQTRSFNYAFHPTFFYSRRIGRQPQRDLDGDEFVHIETPDQTTIATATKLSGKIGDWSIGLLDAVTVEEEARYLDPQGTIQTTPVEPLANYAVGRVKRDFRGGGSVVGALFTATNRSTSQATLADLTPDQAYVGGLDFEHAWANRSWTVSGVFAGSYVSGSEAVIERLQRAPQRYLQRPDAGYLNVDTTATSQSGSFAELALAKTGGKWRGSLTGALVTPGFDVNDLGFQNRADVASLSGAVLYNQNDPGVEWLRRWSGSVYWNVAANGDGRVINRQLNAEFDVQLPSLWGGGISLGTTPVQVYNDRLTRGGPIGRRPADIGINPWVYTDSRKAVSIRSWAYIRTEFVDNPEHDRTVNLDVTVRPHSTISLSFNPRLTSERDTDQYITSVEDAAATATFGTRYVFGDITQTSLSIGLRANWTFTPDLTLQLYARPFVTAGRYAGFKEFRAPGTYEFDVYGRDRGGISAEGDAYVVTPGDGGESFKFDDPDFNFRSLRGSAVVRWEYRPGSALFLVWQQQRNGFEAFGDFDFSRDFQAIFRQDVQNVFLVKATYWLGV